MYDDETQANAVHALFKQSEIKQEVLFIPLNLFPRMLGSLILLFLLFLLQGGIPVPSSASDGIASIHLGYLQDENKVEGCGASLYLSRDYKMVKLSRSAFRTGVHSTYSDDLKHSSLHEVMVMHLDGKDRYLIKDSEVPATDSEGKELYARLKYHGGGYELNIKWMFFDVCDRDNEDCEVVRLRAYIDIHRGAVIRHVRLFGMHGC